MNSGKRKMATNYAPAKKRKKSSKLTPKELEDLFQKIIDRARELTGKMRNPFANAIPLVTEAVLGKRFTFNGLKKLYAHYQYHLKMYIGQQKNGKKIACYKLFKMSDKISEGIEINSYGIGRKNMKEANNVDPATFYKINPPQSINNRSSVGKETQGEENNPVENIELDEEDFGDLFEFVDAEVQQEGDNPADNIEIDEDFGEEFAFVNPSSEVKKEQSHSADNIEIDEDFGEEFAFVNPDSEAKKEQSNPAENIEIDEDFGEEFAFAGPSAEVQPEQNNPVENIGLDEESFGDEFEFENARLNLQVKQEPEATIRRVSDAPYAVLFKKSVSTSSTITTTQNSSKTNTQNNPN